MLLHANTFNTRLGRTGFSRRVLSHCLSPPPFFPFPIAIFFDMLAFTRKRAITAAAISSVIVFTLTAYWWQTLDDHASLPQLFSKLNLATPSNSIGDKVAVIVETLLPVITHFAAVLGPEWPILLFTRASTVQTLAAFDQGSQPFRRMVKAGQVKIIELPTRSSLHNYEGISHFLASK